MKYLYECLKCNVGTVEIDKPMKLVSRSENCATCNTEMSRRYSSIATITGDGHKSAKS